ncbi:MAG TPA: thiamine diphosphokinase [Coriobacteriia bacterium]|nr:thiamine diphosphokinase [Coriobacteriia bacterium]
MPAGSVLIVCAAPSPHSAEHLANLAEAASLVLAVDGGMAACVAAGVTPDVLLGDFDSVEPSLLERAKATGVIIEQHPVDKDVTDLDLALDYVVRAGHTDAVVTACTAGRIDHALAVFGSLSVSALRVRIDEPELGCWFLAADRRAAVDLGGAGATVSVLPLSEAATVTCSGVRWPLDHAHLRHLDSWGMSNIIECEAAHFEVHEGSAVVVSAMVGGVAPARERL